MLTEERHEFIIKEIKRAGLVRSQELMTALNCSESTIRRDLAVLEEAGELARVHGGAKRIYQLDEEMSVGQKTFKNVQEKKIIAEFSAGLVEEDDTIFLDSGTTTLSMIPFLAEKEIRIVTNGVQHASLLADQKNEVILIGGILKNTTKAIVGSTGIQQLLNYRFNKAFLGMNGIDAEFGFTTPDPEEGELKRQAHLHSSKTYILADKSKFNKVNFVKVCSIEDATIVTEQLEHLEFAAFFEKTTLLEAKQ